MQQQTAFSVQSRFYASIPGIKVKRKAEFSGVSTCSLVVKYIRFVFFLVVWRMSRGCEAYEFS